MSPSAGTSASGRSSYTGASGAPRPAATTATAPSSSTTRMAKNHIMASRPCSSGPSLALASTISRTATSTSSVRVSRSRSDAEILPSASTVSRSQSSRPCQYDVPTSTTGNDVILPVCASVSASNSSSNVPSPPGSTMKPWAYLTNMVLRAKK